MTEVGEIARRNVHVIFIMGAIGLCLSMFHSPGAQSAGYLIVIVTQALWLTLLGTFINTGGTVLFFNFIICAVQLISMYYLMTSVKFNMTASNYPDEYLIYATISRAMIFVMLLLQYFIAIPLVDGTKGGNYIFKTILAGVNIFILWIVIGRVRIFNRYFLVTDG
tara:strand:+ start:3995 stop:4489 length:495 start_codon:yes stop_codon:yes gene_type:complete